MMKLRYTVPITHQETSRDFPVSTLTTTTTTTATAIATAAAAPAATTTSRYTTLISGMCHVTYAYWFSSWITA